jgi:hypothetical protein
MCQAVICTPPFLLSIYNSRAASEIIPRLAPRDKLRRARVLSLSADDFLLVRRARETANKVISSKTERRRRFGPGSKFISSQTRLFVRIFLNCLDEIRTAASLMQLLAMCVGACAFINIPGLCVILFLRAARTSTPAPLSAGIIVICRGHISKQQKSFNNKTRAPQAATSTNPRI